MAISKHVVINELKLKVHLAMEVVEPLIDTKLCQYKMGTHLQINLADLPIPTDPQIRTMVLSEILVRYNAAGWRANVVSGSPSGPYLDFI